MNRVLPLSTVLLLTIAPLAAASTHQLSIDPKEAVVGVPAVNGVSDCAGGEIHDDGVPENGYGWNAATVTDGRDVDNFTPTSYPFTYTQACICWVRLGADTDISFNLDVYDDDGPAGAPGTLLGSVPATATGVPTALPGAFYDYDISSLNLNITSGQVFIGPRWNATVEQSFFVCSDQSLTTPLGNGHGFANALPWVTIPSLFPNYRSLLVRAIGGPPGTDLAINKVGLQPVAGTVEYTITVTNNGPGDATGVVVTDPLPAELSYVADDCGASNVPPWTWNIGNLGNGANATCTITLDVVAAGPVAVNNTATVSANEPDSSPGNEASTATLTVTGLVESIPTLGPLAGVALLGALAAGGLVALRRRRTARSE